jgi:hypothetical protein
VPIPESDGAPVFPDGGFGVDGDAEVPEFLTVSHAQPSHGPFVGGTKIVIYGSGFDADVKVLVGGKEIQVGETALLSPVSLEVITPPGEVGPATIEVTSGDERAALPKGFTYDPVFLDPAAGPTTGGTLVTLQGAGTNFAEGMKLELGGQPMLEVEVVSATVLRAKTPPHAEGIVALSFATRTGTVEIEEAFRYYGSANPLTGGMGGGEIQGTLTVSVLDWFTRAAVPDALVFAQKGREVALSAFSDAAGAVVFSAPGLMGPVTVTAGKEKYETTTVVSFDARDLTIFLFPIIEPQPGPLPPGQRMGLIDGFVLFGGTTGAGSTRWTIVPEPKQGQVKRVYLYTTNSTIRFSPPFATPTATIDFNPGEATAWPYSLNTRVGALAVYAMAGLYAPETDKFEPYAMGVARGIVIGPGEHKRVNVMIDIPLTERLAVRIAGAPPRVNRHRLRLGIDLGAEGYIVRDDMELDGDGIPTSLTVGRLPSFTRQGLTDAAYAVDLTLDQGTHPGGLPIVRATALAVQPTAGELLLDALIGPPQQVKPQPGADLQGNTLAWSHVGQASLAITAIELADETPVWRVISRGDVSEVKLPDPTTVGLPAWPTAPMVWLQWLIRLPDFDYDTFDYSHLRSNYWDRWSFDQFSLKVKTP